MTVYVPGAFRRSEGATAGLYVGSPVMASTQWSEYAHNANWLRGKGAQVVCWNSPGTTIASGTTRTFHFRTKTRNAAIQRIWNFAVRASVTTAGSTATIRAPASSGTSVAFAAPFFRELLTPVTYVETVASKATSEVDISFDLTASGGDVVLDGVSCYEQDRAGLGDNTTDYGVMIDTVRAGQPIFALENHSTYAVARALTNADARRTSIYAWVRPDEAPLTRTSATPAAALVIGAPVQTQKLNRTATTGEVKWSVYAKVAGGAGGTVAITTSGSSVSDSVTVTGTSFAWTTARTVSIYCDDFSVIDGRQGGAWDALEWTYAGDGTNLLSVAGLCMWVDSAA